MKKIFVFAAIAAMVAFTACTKEISSEITELEEIAQEEVQPGYVRMSFSAAMESDLTKAYLSGKSVLWTGDESIAVFDHDAGGAANKFDIEGSGASASFTGTVPVGTTSFTAVYPYSDAITYVAGDGSPIRTVIPAVQEATLNSFDPAAAVFVATATSSDAALTFTPAFALFKVNVDVDDVVAVCVSTTTNNLAGSVKVARSGNVGDGDGDKSRVIVLKKSDGSVLTKGVYYIVTRFKKNFENFTLKYYTADALTGSRVSVTGIAADGLQQKDIMNLGSLSAFPDAPHYSLYEYYQAGFDVTIAGETYNVATDGDATLLNDGGVFKTGTNGIIFVKEGASITNTSEATITGDVIITSDNRLDPATYTGTLSKSIVLKSGSLVMDNLIVELGALTSGQFMTKKDNDGNFTALTLNHCDIRNVKRYVFSPNSSFLNNGIVSVKINGCRIGTAADVQLFAVNSNATTLAGYKDFTFTNNVLYSNTGNAQQTYVFATSASGIVESTCNQEVVMDNNLFYNIAASNGIFRTHYLKSIYIRNNILWAKDGSYSSNIKMFKANLNVASASSVFEGASSNNYCFGDLGSKSWSISDTACRGPLTNVTVLDSTPISSFDDSTGEFVLTSTYQTYGPQE